MQYQKVHNVREIIILYLNNMHKQLYNKKYLRKRGFIKMITSVKGKSYNHRTT